MSRHTHADSEASTAVDLYAEEDNFSEHSEHDKQDRHHHFRCYYSTDLIVGRGLTLADVNVEALTQSTLCDMRTWLTARCRDKRCFFGLTDPKHELTVRQRQGDVDTLVPYSQVAELAEKAHELVMAGDDKHPEEEKAAPPPHLQMIQRLLTRVVHDHTRS